mgnify:CR=1 FL=1
MISTLTGDNGSEPTWSWRSKRFQIPANVRKARGVYTLGAVDETLLRVALNGERTGGDMAETFDQADGVQSLQFFPEAPGGVTGSNRWWEIAVSGNRDDILEALELVLSEGDWGDGP